MAGKKAENGQELPDTGSSGAEKLTAETLVPVEEETQTKAAAPETEKTQEEAAVPDIEQPSAEAAPEINQVSMKTEAPEAEKLAAGEKKETWYRVTTNNPVTKKIGPIQFVEGKAMVSSSERWMLTWFREHGYRIEKA